LAAFNQSPLSSTVSHSAAEQLKFLNRAADLLRWARPPSAPVINDILTKVDICLRDVPPAPIHWDLKTDHIFLDGDRVTFVDLDTISLGDPARDPAHLAAHISCRIDVPDMPAPLAHAAARALLDEYFARVPAAWSRQLSLQYAIAALEAACGLFKRQEPRWPERADAAIREAQSALCENRLTAHS
jgi:Ser/Thr protein kinase RdoA (MazF antagonist)